MQEPLRLRGEDLTAAGLVSVARHGRPVALAPEGLARMVAARRIVEEKLSAGEAIYGLTTGLGNRVGHRLTPEVLAEFSRLTIRGRSNSVGPRAPREIVRAAMAARLNALMTGGAGASPALAEALTAALNAGFHPALPMIGSIGAGDLCTMAHIGLGLIGEGEAEWAGTVLPAGEALAKAGLEPLVLGPKDGLSLANCSAFTCGLAALVHYDASGLLDAAEAAAALTLEGFRGNLSPLDPRCVAARPAPGQGASAAHLLTLLAGGALTEAGAARRLQDPISIRAISQLHGSLRAALAFNGDHLSVEINAGADNPVVLIPDDATGDRDQGSGEILSTGNFHTPGLALSLETLGQALAHVGAASASRATKLLSGRFSGLPDNLTRHGNDRSGFAPLYKTLEALVQECRHLALPAPQEQRYGADGVEDEVNATAFSAKKARELLERLGYLIAAELIIAAQAVELADVTEKLGRGTARIHRFVRSLVPPLDDDRPHGADLERLAAALTAGGITAGDGDGD